MVGVCLKEAVPIVMSRESADERREIRSEWVGRAC